MKRSSWDLVGNTPLVEIQSLSKLTGHRIYAKCEHLNPGGSVKDRAAKFMIDQAEKSGALKPGSTIVEGSAGNTGIGLAMLAATRGYRTIITIPDNQAQEKYSMLEALGAEVRKVKPVPFANQEHFYHQAKRIAAEIPGAFWVNQFENPANLKAHEEGTGPEIWRELAGSVDVFTCAVGTGGTMGGVSRSLKALGRSTGRDVRIVLADPEGSGLFSYKKTGTIASSGTSVTEGIGIMRITANFAAADVDDAIQVKDTEMIDMLFHLAQHEGLFVGTSAALNVMAAYKLALADKDSGKTFVTILCDHGSRYQSKLLSAEWRREKGLEPKVLGTR